MNIAHFLMVAVHFILVIGILIFVHELGHFIVAKLMGVKVEKFSLGFGTKLLSKQIGETEYMISAFPLGGYVKMFGETGIIEGGDASQLENGGSAEREMTPEEKSRSFFYKSPLQRIAIVFAGPFFNLVFAWLILVILCMVAFPVMTSRIGKVLPGKPAAKAGIQTNDVIRSINGKKIVEWEEIAPTLASTRGEVLIEVERAAAVLPLRVTPESGNTYSIFGELIPQPVIGISPAYEIKDVHYPFPEAVVVGNKKLWKFVDITFVSIVKMVQGSVSLKNIGGPIQIADMANQAANQGGSNFLFLLAIISINLGVLNLLPVPILDGGHLFFYSWELIFRKPVSMRARELAQQIGLVLLISLMVLAFYNDIVRYFFKLG
jgi:regulator of sigma E protease